MQHNLSSSDSKSVSSNGDLPEPPLLNYLPYQFEPLAADFQHLNLEGNEPELKPTDFNEVGEISRDVQRIGNKVGEILRDVQRIGNTERYFSK